MTIPFFDLKTQYSRYHEEIQARIARVVESHKFIMGPEVPELEEVLADFVGVDHAVACASGTDALLLSLKTCDLKPGDEVITTPFTFFASGGAVVNAGGRPVFVDIDPGTLNIDPACVQAAVTSRTRAIVPVHLFGQMASMEPIMKIARTHGIMVIEDAAQAIGARQTIAGATRAAGSVGATGAFSFFPTKNLGGWGDGGIITTNDSRLAERMRLLRVHGGAKRYHHEEVGTNSRLDTLQAAVLLAKFPHLSEWNDRRRAHAAAYTRAFDALDGVTPLAVNPCNFHVFHQYTVRADRRDDLAAYLKEHGIGSAVYYPVPLHLQQCFADLGYAKGSLPVTEQATAEVLSLPVFPELTDEQRDRVIDRVRAFYS